MRDAPAPQAPHSPIRLGILGAGLAVQWLHWPALQRLRDQFAITAVCDINPAAAAAVAALIGGAPAIMTDYRALLRDNQVEAVLISLPIHLNAQMILETARAGKHVFCEKPLAAHLDQARALVAALEGVPVAVGIAENFHFRPDLARARTWIAEGRIGEVFLVTGEGILWSEPTEGFGATPWRQDHQYRGAVLADAAVHHAAGLRELGGEIEQLQAFVKDVHPVLGGADTLVLNVRFRSGALGTLVFSGSAKAGGGPFARFRVVGREGIITVNTGEIQLLRPQAGNPHFGEVAETLRLAPQESEGYYEEFLDFYQAVRQGRPPHVSPAEALRDFEIIMRALDSAESRAVVLL